LNKEKNGLIFPLKVGSAKMTIMTGKRRVVVTGIGLVTPLGLGTVKNWQALIKGESGIGSLSAFDASAYRTSIAGEVKGFDPYDYMEKKVARRTSRFIQFASAAGLMALEDAKLKIEAANADRIGTSLATALGGIDSFEKNHNLVIEGKRDRVSPFFIPSYICNLAAGEVAIQFGLKGPLMCSVTACAAGTHALGEALRTIQYGDAEAMLAGGSEAQMSATLLAGLDALHVLSTRNNEPARASRPFAKDRDGFVLSEGCGILVLEELQFALKRGARIYAEISGYGNNCDAYHITSPDPNGRGAVLCMQRAIQDAGLGLEQIDHINAHGTATLTNDLTETRAIKQLFGERSRHIPITANKSMLGHLWGAAGAVEAAISVLTIVNGIIPPTINLEEADPECDLDYVPLTARPAEVNHILSNSFGFGGTNACLVLSRYTP
jgi:3-oxoacyl-[acyl-carrier-protein] synthase II